MHWVLTISKSFSLTQILQRSQLFLNLPFGSNRALEHLYRVERLSSGHIITLMISQTPAGLVIRTNERLNSKETEEISHKTWRMLRLGENLEAFVERAKRTHALHSVNQKGARILRGTTFFEDLIKSIVLAREAETWQLQRIAWIVDSLGDPLPSNPTHHTFPTPQQLLWGEKILKKRTPTLLADKLIKIAEVFQMEPEHIQKLETQSMPLETCVAEMKQIFNLDDETLGLIMLSLGRYDYIPVSQSAQLHVSQYWHEGREINPQEVRSALADWQPWGGLAYWLWDWTTAPDGTHTLNNEVSHGKLEN